MRVVSEEIFGPVVCAMPGDDVDDLVRKANDTIYGLAAGIWTSTSDLKKAHFITDGLRAGTVWINCYNFLNPASPSAATSNRAGVVREAATGSSRTRSQERVGETEMSTRSIAGEFRLLKARNSSGL